MKRKIVFTISVFALLFSGCSYRVSQTSNQVTIDGANVDYSDMSKYKKGEQCYDARSDGSMSILEAAKKAGITKIVHVDNTIDGSTHCSVVYGY